MTQKFKNLLNIVQDTGFTIGILGTVASLFVILVTDHVQVKANADDISKLNKLHEEHVVFERQLDKKVDIIDYEVKEIHEFIRKKR